jgi:peptidoglycan/xylan/chitin deacetylase (PgdA/CDA1 family)
MFKVDSVAKWRGNATAAYSIIHDDVCDDSALGVFSSAQPLLKAHGLTAGFGVIVGECDKTASDDTGDVDPNTGKAKWDEVKSLQADGNDIFSHSWDHPCIDGFAADGKTIAQNPYAGDACGTPSTSAGDGLTVYAAPSAETHELGDAADKLKAELLPSNPDFSNDFFIFPYDYCNTSAITFLKNKGYLGARCGLPDDTTMAPVSPSDFADGFQVFYDVFGPAYSHYVIDIASAQRGGGCSPVVQYCNAPYASGAGDQGCTGTAANPDQNGCCPATSADPESCISYINNQYVDDTIAQGGWGIREFHGFHPLDDEDGFETISEADYGAHLDYIKTKQDQGSLWVSGPSPVLRYRFAREACGMPTITGGNTLHFDTPSADCTKYKTIVSYLIETTDASDPALMSVKQGGRSLPVKKISAGHFVVDANPTLGDAVLSL